MEMCKLQYSKTAKTDSVQFADLKFPKQYNKLEVLVVLCGISVRVFYFYTEKKTPRFFLKKTRISCV